jgi:hypothetical protein
LGCLLLLLVQRPSWSAASEGGWTCCSWLHAACARPRLKDVQETLITKHYSCLIQPYRQEPATAADRGPPNQCESRHANQMIQQRNMQLTSNRCSALRRKQCKNLPARGAACTLAMKMHCHLRSASDAPQECTVGTTACTVMPPHVHAPAACILAAWVETRAGAAAGCGW